MRSPHEIRDVDDATEEVTQSIQVSGHAPVFPHTGSIEDAVHYGLAFLAGDEGEFLEAFGAREVLVLDQAALV